MRILIDAMGGDNAPMEIVKGSVQAARELPHEIVLLGIEKEIRKALDAEGDVPDNVTVIHCSEVVENEDAPVRAVRSKKDSSMVVGMKMLKEKQGDLLLSAGNSGAFMAGGLFVLGRMKGIDRPAFAAAIPAFEKGFTLLVDSGANSECKANNLVEFATLGSIYAEKVMGVERPAVGLLNMGTEEGKGPLFAKEAHEKLKQCKHLNFIGNVEARDVPGGICDVLACDGFTGNVLLKTMEGMGTTLLKMLKDSIMGGGATVKLGGALLSKHLHGLKSQFDYSEYGGAPILGVKGALVKMHGSSDARAVYSAIKKALPYGDPAIIEMMEKEVLDTEALLSDE